VREDQKTQKKKKKKRLPKGRGMGVALLENKTTLDTEKRRNSVSSKNSEERGLRSKISRVAGGGKNPESAKVITQEILGDEGRGTTMETESLSKKGFSRSEGVSWRRSKGEAQRKVGLAKVKLISKEEPRGKKKRLEVDQKRASD